MTTTIADARTLLFVPGGKPELFAKAAASGADGFIADLEDAVAPEAKDAARALAVEGLAQAPGVVRINAVGTPWHNADLAAVAGAPGVTGVMLPKAEDAEAVRAVAERLAGTPLLLLVESALGVRDVAALAQVPGVTRLSFGNLDFALDAGIEPRSDDEDELLFARSAITLASRAAGLPGPMDGVLGDFRNDDLMARRTRRAFDLGFRGKLCIHPRQVAVVHEAIAPSEEEVAWARRIVDGAGALEGAAVQVDGEMVDRPVLLKARDILARA
ncbi:HpcH/HpaI aldolase/citrate lyase family protein [Cumulibacter manganitolerans]|uniref:HpcH/HpaI aldolase/citrate lyase family protein n=1 Tax=Cumulibacter manganitolerans TaxID=1884992 RepID=UPI001297A704|nr:CoA ester lyase [Cumulibacter manganitolerans]